MAPAPSPNACGLAAYRQLAGNLRIDDIKHGYWTSRKGNATRYSLWHERRRHAAPWLRRIAPVLGGADATTLEEAAVAFEEETKRLDGLTKLFPVGGDEKAHWEEENIVRAEKLLEAARGYHETGMELLQRVVKVDFAPFQTKDADALQELVADEDLLVSQAALDALVRLAPKDLDRRLAELFESEPDARKNLADGPIHRQLIWALIALDTEIATEAIGKAVFFPGESDAVKPAISGWAAEVYWERKGKDGRAVFVKALDSKTPHVADLGLKYVGLIGDESLLPRVKEFETPAGWYARILLGDESAYPKLFAGLATPDWWESYSRLRELGAQVEEHAFPFLASESPQMVTYVAILLSRVGTAASVAPIEKAVEEHPDNSRLAQALADLKKRIE